MAEDQQQPEAEAAPKRKKYVEYQGSGTRVITKKDAKGLGATLSSDLVWNKANNWKVEAGELPQEILDYVKIDNNFRVK